jgi:tetratricopeptide (TPR) repeat protein
MGIQLIIWKDCIEFCLENFEKVLEIDRKLRKTDSTFIFGPLVYNLTGQYEEAYQYFTKLIEIYKKSEWIPLQSSHRIGYALWKMGEYEEAKYYFNQQIKYCMESIELGRTYGSSKNAHYDLAGVYAFLGDKAKAYQYLDEIDKRDFMNLVMITIAKHDPLFDSI